MNWWLNIMPLEDGVDKNATISYQNKSRELNAEHTASEKDPGLLLDRFCGAARELITVRYSVVAIPAENENSLVHISVAGTNEDFHSIGFPPDHDLFTSVMKNRLPVRLQIQLHKYLWGNEPGR